MQSFAAIDLHSNNGVLTVIDENDRVLRQKKLARACCVAPQRRAGSAACIERARSRSRRQLLEPCSEHPQAPPPQQRSRRGARQCTRNSPGSGALPL